MRVEKEQGKGITTKGPMEVEDALQRQPLKRSGLVFTLPPLSPKNSFLAFKMLTNLPIFQITKSAHLMHFQIFFDFCIILHICML